MTSLEDVWRLREDAVYPDLFGPVRQGVYVLDQEIFDTFGNFDIDPRWMTHGVFEFAPHGHRTSWVYVTSGYSNPWHQEPGEYDSNGDSGLGIEFLMETDRQGNWAIFHLRRLLAFDMLASAGAFGATPIGRHDCIPLRSPIDGVDGHDVQNVVCVKSDWPDFALPSGGVSFSQFIGVTNAEREFASENGTDALLTSLAKAGVGPVVVPDRDSIV